MRNKSTIPQTKNDILNSLLYGPSGNSNFHSLKSNPLQKCQHKTGLSYKNVEDNRFSASVMKQLSFSKIVKGSFWKHIMFYTKKFADFLSLPQTLLAFVRIYNSETGCCCRFIKLMHLKILLHKTRGLVTINNNLWWV